MGDSVQLNDVKGCYQNDKMGAEYETLNPDLVEEGIYTIPTSHANTSTERYPDEPKPKNYNSPIIWSNINMRWLLLIIALLSTAILSVFVHILVSRNLLSKTKILFLYFYKCSKKKKIEIEH